MNTGVHENVLNDCESKSHVFTAHAAYIQPTAISGSWGNSVL